MRTLTLNQLGQTSYPNKVIQGQNCYCPSHSLKHKKLYFQDLWTWTRRAVIPQAVNYANTALQVSQKLLRALTTQNKNNNNNKIKAHKHRTSTYLCNFSQHLMKCIFFWDSISIYKCQIWNITCIHHLCNLCLCRINEHSISGVIHKGMTFYWILHKLCYLWDSIRILCKVTKKAKLTQHAEYVDSYTLFRHFI